MCIMYYSIPVHTIHQLYKCSLTLAYDPFENLTISSTNINTISYVSSVVTTSMTELQLPILLLILPSTPLSEFLYFRYQLL